MIWRILRWFRPDRPFPRLDRVAYHRDETWHARVIRNGRRFDQLDRERR